VLSEYVLNGGITVVKDDAINLNRYASSVDLNGIYDPHNHIIS